MPKSKVRKKPSTPARLQTPESTDKALAPSPAWWPVVMSIVLVLGLAYLVVYYIAGSSVPLMKDLSNIWNMAIGFGIMLLGLLMAVRWR